VTSAASDDMLAPVRNPVDGSGPPFTEPAGEVDPGAAMAVVPVAVAVAEPWSGTVIDPVPTEADDIAAAALTVTDVMRLHAGRFGEVATYLPGRRVTGVRLGDDLIEVHVVVAGQVPIPETGRQIRAALAALVATPVHVHIEDIDVPAGCVTV
jgi:hypothetical protein